LGAILQQADRLAKRHHVADFERDIGIEFVRLDSFENGYSETGTNHVSQYVREQVVVEFLVVRTKNRKAMTRGYLSNRT
jgi:hypothetical protein